MSTTRDACGGDGGSGVGFSIKVIKQANAAVFGEEEDRPDCQQSRKERREWMRKCLEQSSREKAN
jgi:hypothetical protein